MDKVFLAGVNRATDCMRRGAATKDDLCPAIPKAAELSMLAAPIREIKALA